MDLFIKKTTEELLLEADNEGGNGLKRVLGMWGLIALGVGVIIGAGCIINKDIPSYSVVRGESKLTIERRK